MRTLVILLLLCGAGFVAWKWYGGRSAAPAPVTAPAAGGNGPATSQPTSGNGGFGDSGQIDAPLPQELKAAYDQAEALWAAQGKDGAPVSVKAPLLDKLYSKVLQGIYNKPEHKALELRLVAERLTPLGNELFFSKTRYPEDETGILQLHEALPGENPDRIAKHYGMSVELLNRLRGMTNLTDSSLHAGDRVKVVAAREKGGYLLHVKKKDFYLDCYIAGLFARRYAISIGAKETPTPVGKTRLVDRVLDPPWTDPHTHEEYKPGDPRNILGGVWMSFSPDGIGQSGLGIHGYTGPDARMQAMVSNGCVRLDTIQAKELYQTLPHPERCQTQVEIVE